MPVLPLPAAQSSIQRCVESLVEIRKRLACRQLGQQELLGEHRDALGHLVDREHHALDEGQEIPPLGANDGRERHLDDGDALRYYLTGVIGVWFVSSVAAWLKKLKKLKKMYFSAFSDSSAQTRVVSYLPVITVLYFL